MKRRLALVVALLGIALGIATTTAASELVYQTFDPLVIPSTYTGTILYELKLTAPATRVVLALNTPNGSTDSRALHDDGTSGDRVRGDHVYALTLAAADVIPLLRRDDVFRAEVGYVEVYDGTTLATRGNVFADVLTDGIPIVPVIPLAGDAQRTDYVVNLVAPGFVQPSRFDFESLLRRFYDLFPDEFDFVSVIAFPYYFQNRFHFGVKNDARGIGVEPYDVTAQYGSAGRLLGITMFPNANLFDPAETAFQHELGHQWINYLPFAPLNDVLPHWPLSDLASGIMGFAETGYGQGLEFPCAVTPVAGGATLAQRLDPPVFTDLDLYLMGLLPPEQVGSHVVFPRGTQSADLLNACGGTWSGALQTVTIEDIVQRAGPRVPDEAHSRHNFRVATIIVSDALLSQGAMSFYSHFAQRASLTTDTLYHSGFARGLAKPFYLATRGHGTLDPRLVEAPAPGASASSPGFASITLADIAAGARLSGQPIDGSDGTGDLAPGTILVYRTSEGRYGKLEVLASGYDLTISFVTYASSGTVWSSSDSLIVPGTFLLDLDSGDLAIESDDLQWAQRTETVREFVPLNGAVFGLWPT